VTAAAAPGRLVGARVKRREDPRLMTGSGTYVDDVRLPGTLHLAFVRSDHAHAEITKIELAAALEVPGVVAVLTADDLEGVVSPVLAQATTPGYQPSMTPPLARGKVRYVGDPVVAVVAESRAEAEDGAEVIWVDYDPLPTVVTIEEALADDAPRIHDEVMGNLFNQFTVSTGDVDRAFAQATHTIELRPSSQRITALPMEARGIVATWDRTSEDLTIWVSHQAPHLFRSGIAKFVGMPESRIRVISPDVGGGFGSKLIIYQEDLVAVAAARITNRPVKWISDRREDLLTSMQGRDQHHVIQAAVDDRGVVLGLRADISADNGAYAPWPFTAALDAGQCSENLPGPYAISAYERSVRSVVTNKTQMGPYRGVGRVSAALSIELLMDEIGRRLDLDPLEVRRRNVVRTYPYRTAGGLTFESGSSAESLDLMAETLDLEGFRREQQRLRTDGVYRGVGFSAVVEHNSLGPKQVAQKDTEIGMGLESALLRIEPDGDATLIVGTHSHGQGHETTFAQIVADELGIDHERIRVRFGDTSVAPYGLGTWASRSLVYAGGATMLAAEDIRNKMRAIAAHELEVTSDDLVFEDGRFAVRGVPGAEITVQQIARLANHGPHLLPDDLEPGLESSRWYRAPDPGSFSNSLHAAVIDVDIETGTVQFERYIVIEDCGRVVNPTVVEGQIIGGVAQGIGQALLEEIAFDDDGQPLSTTLLDYLMPLATDVPKVEVLHLESPSPHTLGGFKGMGEGGAINAPAAVVNAINDALAPFGIVAEHTPVTPNWILDQLQVSRSKESQG
jgi:aerobic carbon-monoxide dehydrogenase large subunit